MNKCLLVHSGNMVVMALLSLLHLSHGANKAERIIYILKLFHETSCSTESLVHTMRFSPTKPKKQSCASIAIILLTNSE